MEQTGISRLKRPLNAVPAFIEEALNERGLMDVYHSRPAYQQNDYIGWITGAKTDVTLQKRLNQMLDELEAGDVYMNMMWHSS
jgi:hypothetical protein